jgi:ubiquinone/menaquinone biosynthesis C-methylase UbiE
MPEQLSLDDIRNYWTAQANAHGKSHAASWSDRYAIDLEIGRLASCLDNGDRVLDVGCANGYSTIQYAAAKPVRLRGLDYIPEMIEQAHGRLAEFPGRLQGEVEFAVGDITNLDEPDATYDKVIVTRVVINLHDWEHQRKALHECARVVKPGGRLLLSEATLQGWRRMNALRTEWGLPEIPMPGFNLYLDEDQVTDALAGQMELERIDNFASTYFVATRVIKPLLAEALGGTVDPALPEMEWNRWAAQLPAWGDYGTQKLFVFRRLTPA